MNLSEQAKGKWAAILPACGVDKKYLSARHGPCPLCAGKDRFRFDDKGKGLWFCNQCGAGDGVSLVMKVNGYSFKEAAREIERHIGTAPVIAIRNGPAPEAVKRDMNAIWLSGVKLSALSATAAWWNRRLGEVPDFADLRGVRGLTMDRTLYPGMVALIRDVDGKPVNMHRTFLSNDGQKADVCDPRRVMPLPLPKGSAVRLGAYDDVLGIAEGIETAAAASKMFDVPCWAALTAQNLKEWSPPEGVKRIIVFGDNDISLTGHAASYALAQRLTVTNHHVEVRIPDRIGTDWNDIHMEAIRSPELEEA